KGGIGRDGKTTFLVNSENPVLVEAETKSISALVQPQEQPAVPTAQPFINEPIHQGTTVLKGRTFDALSPRNIPSAVPQFSPPPETTVLTPPKQDIPETTVLIAKSPIQETTVLKNTIAPQKTACLIRLKNHSRFFINKPLFSIGRGLSETDCSVNDNTNVSRHHADIVRYDPGYFLSVITKTNVTYLNEIKLEQGAEVKLADGDKIRLADEEFEFRIV
ncbi:MAG: FHA domain-containing protein, partial [Oscillospiraceae bacterium]|nr:FHA domain-containing protein [Oscillospiraceae bacterium]